MKKQIIKDQKIVEDNWVYLTDEDNLPGSGSIILNLERWQTEKDKLQKFPGKLGIRLDEGENIEELIQELDQFSLIAISFKEFKDGRGYSHARLLRERHGYNKELRAIGNILKDQIFYLHRCGFNAFEIESDRDINDAIKSFTDFTVNYQPAVI